MPILAAEPALYPADLLDHDLCDVAGDRQWWALYVKARAEKALARELLAQDIPFYLPLVEKTVIRRGRRRESYAPLFSSYVFLFGSPEERRRSLTTNRVVHTVNVVDQQGLHHDLRQVRQAIESDAPLTPEARLRPGARVRVVAGCMAGLEGTVLQRGRKSRLLIWVRVLGQGVSMEIDDFLLEEI